MAFNAKEIVKNPIIYLIVFAIGISMRLFNLTDSLWLDEIWSMLTSAQDKSAMDIINACKTDTHPPLYDLLLHYVLVLFGDEDITARFLSLIIGLISIIASYFYTLKISKNHLAAFLSFSLVSLSYFHIFYSNEGRFYTLLYLLSLGVTAQLYLFLKDERKWDLILFTIFSVIISYTHYYGVILLFGLSLIVLFLMIIKEITSKTFISFIISGGIILLLYLPWLPYMLSGSEGESWMNQANLGQFFEYLYNYTGKNPIEFIFILIGLIFSVKHWSSDKKLYSILYGSILLGFLIPLLVSYLSIPMLHIRYTLIYFPSLIILVAIFWDKTEWLSSRKKNAVFIGVFLAILINFFFINDITTKGIHREQWKEIAIDIARVNYNSNESIYAELEHYLNYYLDKYDHKEAQTFNYYHGEKSFWLLRTPYDSVEDLGLEFKITQSIDYGNDFVLEHYVLKE